MELTNVKTKNIFHNQLCKKPKGFEVTSIFYLSKDLILKYSGPIK